MFEQAVLGIIQGIVEWLPVSSEGLIVLAKTNIFSGKETFGLSVRQALFLHLGTFLAALIYFWKDVFILLKALISYKNQPLRIQKLLQFLVISTLISGALGFILIQAVSQLAQHLTKTSQMITLLIGVLLIITGILEIKAKKGGYRSLEELTVGDSILLGIVQGFAALPGLSRSGLTVSLLLLRKFDKTIALKLSFLMSLPVVLGGNLILNHDAWQWPPETYTGVMLSFVFGILTIHLLLKLAKKINFGIFVLFFAALTIFSIFV